MKECFTTEEVNRRWNHYLALNLPANNLSWPSFQETTITWLASTFTVNIATWSHLTSNTFWLFEDLKITLLQQLAKEGRLTDVVNNRPDNLERRLEIEL
jgi:hypothetical protein